MLRLLFSESQIGVLKRALKKVRYFGSRYECPICDSKVRQLHSFGFGFPVLLEKNVIGGGYRENAQCPVCGSVDRERLVYLYLSKKTNIFQCQNRLLHVAPEGSLPNLLHSHSNIDYLTADLLSEEVMVKMDITDIQYPDNSFDVVICNHVLEHIIDDRKAMRETHRVIKPGGWAILQVPMSLALSETYENVSIVSDSDREAAFGQYNHVRIYAMDYIDRLKESGFQVEVFKWWESEKDFGGASNKYGLLPDELLYFVTK